MPEADPARPQPRSTTRRQKTALVLLGLVGALVLAEGLFRIGGLFAGRPVPSHGSRDGSYKLLCIGDSSTYGLGASDPARFSYPARLQQLLNENAPGRTWQVVNLGIPGMNSSQALNRLRGNIREHRPDIVIVMVGINDTWNLEESRIVAFYRAGRLQKVALACELLVNRLRVYRFFKLLCLSAALRRDGPAQELTYALFTDDTRSHGFQLSEADDARSRALRAAIRHNIQMMKLVAEENGTNVMFMRYHDVGWGRAEVVLNDVYPSLNVPIVDNLSVFQRAAALGWNVRAEDRWHPNDLGYLLIARNVFNMLVATRVAQGPPLGLFVATRSSPP